MKKGIQTLTLSNGMTLSYQQHNGQLGLLIQIHIGEKLSQATLKTCDDQTILNYVVDSYFLTRSHDLGINLITVPGNFITTYEINEGLDDFGFIGLLKHLDELFTFIDFTTLRDVKARVIEQMTQTQRNDNKEFGAAFLDDEFATASDRISHIIEVIQKLTLQDLQDYISALYVPRNIHLVVTGAKEFETFSQHVQNFKM